MPGRGIEARSKDCGSTMSRDPRLHARPQPVTAGGFTGLQSLPLGSMRDSYLYAPPSYDPASPSPMVLLLHGAGGHAQHGLDLLSHLADEANLVLVAPSSASHSWDVIVSRAYGADVALLDQALEHVFARFAVDRSRLAIGGFSDGASYALSLGLANGDLFTHVIAFSPGFIAPVPPRGQPKVFMSHGSRDSVLPIDSCSRMIVPWLRGAKYEVTYEEFDGRHEIPAWIARRAVEWLMGKKD